MSEHDVLTTFLFENFNDRPEMEKSRQIKVATADIKATELISRKTNAVHWWKLFLRKKSFQDLLSSLNAGISINERH